MEVGEKRKYIYPLLHCHHQNDSCIKMGSGESHFNVSLILRDKVTTVPTDQNVWRERTAEADSNRGPSAYQPNALPLGQTGSQVPFRAPERGFSGASAASVLCCVGSRTAEHALFSTFFAGRVSVNGRCHVWPWLCEFSGVALGCFTLSCLTISPDVSLIEPEFSFNPLFKAIYYSVSSVRKHVIRCKRSI